VKLASRIYEASPPWLQNLLVSGYGYRLRALRYGGIYDRVLAELRKSQWFDEADLARIQLEHLRTVVGAARRNVPFYRDRGGLPDHLESLTDLRTVPILKKADIHSAGRRLVSERYAGHQLLTVHTGGTTGTPLTIYCDAPTRQRNFAFISRLKEWAGAGEGDRTATFAGRLVVPSGSGPPYWRRNRAANTWLFSSYHIGPDTVSQYVEALARIQPELIDSYPSSLEPIARYILAEDIRSVRPKAIITSSETLFPSVRNLLEEAFDCPVRDHYGAAEMAGLIAECEHGRYHVNSEFGVIEILRDGAPVGAGEVGEIVATGFVNPVMPLIRYATGDLAVRGSGEICPCGRAFPTIERIEGRVDETIVTPEGRRVGRIDPVFKVLSTPLEIRIIQDARDHLTVEFVSDRPLPEAEQTAFRKELKGRVGASMAVTFKRVDHIARAGSGKRRTVVNRVGRDDRERRPDEAAGTSS